MRNEFVGEHGRIRLYLHDINGFPPCEIMKALKSTRMLTDSRDVRHYDSAQRIRESASSSECHAEFWA